MVQAEVQMLVWGVPVYHRHPAALQCVLVLVQVFVVVGAAARRWMCDPCALPRLLACVRRAAAAAAVAVPKQHAVHATHVHVFVQASMREQLGMIDLVPGTSCTSTPSLTHIIQTIKHTSTSHTHKHASEQAVQNSLQSSVTASAYITHIHSTH